MRTPSPRALALLLPLLGTPGLSAQVPPQPPWVPVMPRERGGMSVGCPADWEHREAGVGYFSCRDTDTGAFCNGTSRPSPTLAIEAVIAAVRAEITGRGWAVIEERRDRGLHSFTHDDSAGHRVVRVVRAASGGRRVDVTCGSDPARATGLLPVFLEIARMAR